MMFVYFTIASLVWGSFLGVLVTRFHTGVDRSKIFTGGRSYCPDCRHTLIWSDLIPLYSYFRSKGRCRYCKKNISFWYPTTEIITAIFLPLLGTFLYSHLRDIFPLGLGYDVFVWTFLVCLISSALIHIISDLRYQELPDEINIFLVFLALIWITLLPEKNLFSHILGAGIPILFFFGVELFSKYFLKKTGIGMGDIKLVPSLGLILGSSSLLPWFFLSYIGGSIIGIALIVFQKNRQAYIPFGPFILVSFFISWIFGEEIFRWYIDLITYM
jgi:leader peptidase (prepilin peptidase) / N-methyltransferase